MGTQDKARINGLIAQIVATIKEQAQPASVMATSSFGSERTTHRSSSKLELPREGVLSLKIPGRRSPKRLNLRLDGGASSIDGMDAFMMQDAEGHILRAFAGFAAKRKLSLPLELQQRINAAA